MRLKLDFLWKEYGKAKEYGRAILAYLKFNKGSEWLNVKKDIQEGTRHFLTQVIARCVGLTISVASSAFNKTQAPKQSLSFSLVQIS